MDSLGGKLGEILSHNVFAYCNNNAVNMVDPNGRFAIIAGFIAAPVIVKVFFAAAAALATVYTYYTVVKPLVSDISDYITYADSSTSSGNASGSSSTGGGTSPKPPKKPRKTTHGHHSYPKYLGGAAAQKLVELAPDVHRKIHAVIHQFEGGWLAPKRGYTGKMIQRIYTSNQIQDGLIRFYNSCDEFKDLVEPLKNAIEYTMGK